MPFEAGTRVGPYEVIAPIGAGGMGEVYRARDTRLDRVVAIKVLTGALASDAESRQRFEHEARVIAALNDPHICTIHDVGQHGDLDYLVLEFLEGETLAERLRRAPALTVADALDIAIQIGDALDRAHRAGIVHRDLKPANVMLLRSGSSSAPLVKLLDFGLATRVTIARPAIATASLGETMTAPPLEATRLAPVPASGFSGTVQYMAPEQIEGDPGDHRTDIFAFGCVLYEMLAGRKAFEGTNAVTVIAAVASSEPPPIAALQSAHPVLNHVMRRCLEKDRERRWQHIGDVTGELRWIAAQPIAPVAAAAPGVPKNRLALTLLVAALALAATAGQKGMAISWTRDRQYVLIRREGTSSGTDLVAVSTGSPSREIAVAQSQYDEPEGQFSPDGKWVAFVSNDSGREEVFVQSFPDGQARTQVSTAGGTQVRWSADGHEIFYVAPDGKMMAVSIATSGARPVLQPRRLSSRRTW